MNQSSLSSQLNNFSLTYYGYHLRNSLDEGQETVPKASHLWEQLVTLGHTLNSNELINLPSKLICYENKQYKPKLEDQQKQDYFSLLSPQTSCQFDINTSSGLIIKGDLNPLRLHDSYAIDLTLFPEHSLTPEQLQFFNLFSDLNPSLGQSLVIYADLTISVDEYEPLAKDCLNFLFSPSHTLTLKSEGNLLNLSFFVYDNYQTDSLKYDHVLFAFNPNSIIPEEIGQANESFLYLFWSYHKILFAFHESGNCNKQAREIYSQLEDNIDQFYKIAQLDSQTRLEEFKKLLFELPGKSLSYSRYVRNLEDHKNTIEVNLINLKQCYNDLKNLNPLPNDDLRFLDHYVEFTESKLKAQLKADLSFLTPGKQLFEQLLNAIRGIIAVDQIANDRLFALQLQTRDETFEKQLEDDHQKWLESLKKQDEDSQTREKNNQLFIAFIGTGLAVSGISASAIPDPGEKLIKASIIDPWIKNHESMKFIVYNFSDLLIHIIIGLIFGYLGYCFMAWKQKQDHKKNPVNNP